MQEIDKFVVKVNIIPNTLEKYMAFTINKNLIFIDSMQFMNSGLDVLVKNLTDNDFKYLSQLFNGEQLNLVKQKRVYPCEYMNSLKKNSENRFPDRCEIYSSLKDKCISENDRCTSEKDERIKEEDYLHFANVWNEFEMKSLGDYHDLCLKTDVLLLTVVLEKFINLPLNNYGLDPCHYFSIPG